MHFSSTVAIAECLLGESVEREPIIERIRDNLRATNGFHLVPTETAVAASDRPAGVCVDGAVISSQTDTLLWVAVAATTSDGSIEHQAAAATPTGSHGEAVRSGAMAAAELLVAVHTADQVGHVWMDGSLRTPLIALAASLSAVPEEAADAWARTLRDAHIVDLVGGYIELAYQGRVSALPKQDTVSVFAREWSELVDGADAQWLRLQRDRTLVADLLTPGMFLAPRAAPELNVLPTPDSPHRALRQLQEDLADVLTWWREVPTSVTYVMPRHLHRPIKVELVCDADTVPHERAAAMATTVDRLCRGPVMLEPRHQWEADHRAKRLVAVVDMNLRATVAASFGERRPDAVRGYRT